MDYASLAIWIIALALGVTAYFRGKLHLQGVKIAWKYTLTMYPRIIVAILVSGFFSTLAPGELIASWLGKESDIQGILIASLLGGFTPGGPLICFPIIVILFKAGAGIPQLIAFLTAWSVFAFHRIISYEIPFMGFRFVIIRILSSLVLPPLAGILAAILEGNILTGQ